MRMWSVEKQERERRMPGCICASFYSVRKVGGEGSPLGSDYLMKQQMLHQQNLSISPGGEKSAVPNWINPTLGEETITAKTQNEMTLNCYIFNFTKKEVLVLWGSPWGPCVGKNTSSY